MRNPVADEARDEQKRLNSYFAREASYWREIYQRNGIKELVHQQRLRSALELVDGIGLPSETPVLDIGCGAGLATVALAQRGYAVDAIDPVQAMVDSTRDRVTRAGLERRVRVGLGDIYSLPFRDETFAIAIALGVLPWLPSIEKPLREAARVLQQVGHLIVSVDNRWGLRWFLEPLTNPLLRPAKEVARRVMVRFGREKPIARSHFTSIRELDALLIATGFDKVKGITLGFGPFSCFNRELLPCAIGLRVHQALQDLAGRESPVLRSAGSQYIVCARKRDVALSRALR